MLKAHSLYSAARELNERIAPTEAAIDHAISLQAELIARVPEARLSAGLPMSTGHQALVRLAAAMSATITARGEFLAAHEEFAAVRDELRIPITSTGSSEGCPSPNSAVLKVVQAA